MGHPRRKKSAREHQAAVELASNRRQLSKLLKKEGFEPVPLDKKPKLVEDTSDEKEEAIDKTKTREEREQERTKKLQERKKRASHLLKRTKTGQPIMRNLVGDLVSQLSRDSSKR
jgi:hypothetical protein